MILNQLFDKIDRVRETANWQAAFGPPQVVEGKTIIPVARVSYLFGVGFGSVLGPEAETESVGGSQGGGEGGGASTKPLGAIVVTPERVYFEPVLDVGKIAWFGLGLAALLLFQLSRTIRLVLGRKASRAVG